MALTRAHTFINIVFRHTRHAPDRKVFHLHGGDGDRNPRGEAEHHGNRELYSIEFTETRRTHCQQDNP